jgi:hypothetical protein
VLHVAAVKTAAVMLVFAVARLVAVPELIDA